MTLVTPTCLSDLIAYVHSAHATAGMPSASGDGLPHFLLGIHAALSRAATSSPVASVAWLAQALALTLDAAEGAAPEVMFQQLSSEHHAQLTADGLNLDDLAELGRCDTSYEALHRLAAESLAEFGRMSADSECAPARVISPLSRLAVSLAQRIYELGESPSAWVLDVQLCSGMLLPYREATTC